MGVGEIPLKGLALLLPAAAEAGDLDRLLDLLLLPLRFGEAAAAAAPGDLLRLFDFRFFPLRFPATAAPSPADWLLLFDRFLLFRFPDVDRLDEDLLRLFDFLFFPLPFFGTTPVSEPEDFFDLLRLFVFLRFPLFLLDFPRFFDLLFFAPDADEK